MNKEIYVVNRFKSFIRVSLRNYRVDLYRISKKMQNVEIHPSEFFERREFYDEYDFLENNVAVLDFKMTVKNDLLYEVLNSMEQHQRDIVYLSLCEEWSDRKIGLILNMSRSKVQRIKQQMKREIYEAMMGEKKNEN